MQGTCKYGTRVDYIMASPDSPFRFVPGSYSVFSSKGTSDHHIVRVDLIKSPATLKNPQQDPDRRQHRQDKQQRVVKITNPSLHQPNGVWRNTVEQDYIHSGKLMN